MSAALLLVRCLNNVEVCDVGHPWNEPSRIFKGYLSATVHASNLAITRLCHCDSQWSPTLCGAKGEFMAILESGERLSARTILIDTDLVDERPQIKNVRQLYAKNAQSCPYCDGWEVDVSRSRCSAKPRTRPNSQSSWCSAVRTSFFAPTRCPLATTKTKKEVAMSGADFDRAYLKQSGVEGPSGAERDDGQGSVKGCRRHLENNHGAAAHQNPPASLAG